MKKERSNHQKSIQTRPKPETGEKGDAIDKKVDKHPALCHRCIAQKVFSRSATPMRVRTVTMGALNIYSNPKGRESLGGYLADL